jgi:hypothetical protein
MTSPADLTTLANAKAWLSGNPPVGSQDDALLGRLITEASRLLLSTISSPPLQSASYTDYYDGIDGDRLMMRRFPVTAVTALNVNGSAVAIAPPLTSGNVSPGYAFQQWNGIPPARTQLLYYRGGRFPRGSQNIAVTVTAGYLVASESQVALSTASPAYSFPVNAPYGPWNADNGVVYANTGVALTKVGSAPAVGQYSVVAGVYQLSAADANAPLLVSYSFTPADLEQACIELVGERYRYKGRIGMVSESQGGHISTSFTQKDMSDHIKSILNQYKNVVPL